MGAIQNTCFEKDFKMYRKMQASFFFAKSNTAGICYICSNSKDKFYPYLK